MISYYYGRGRRQCARRRMRNNLTNDHLITRHEVIRFIRQYGVGRVLPIFLSLSTGRIS